MSKARRGRLRVPSYRRTLQYAIQSVRLRLGRCLIAAACVMGAIAFLCYNVLAVEAVRRPPPSAAPPVAQVAHGEASAFFDGLAEFTADKGAAQKRVFVIMLALLVSFVGITNSMLMSIKERFREIATLKCVGALNRYIRRLFLIESLLQGGMGSVIGCLTGVVLHVLFQDPVTSLRWVLQATAMCLGAGVGITLLAAIWPIHAALRMLPVEALRVEE